MEHRADRRVGVRIARRERTPRTSRRSCRGARRSSGGRPTRCAAGCRGARCRSTRPKIARSPSRSSPTSSTVPVNRWSTIVTASRSPACIASVSQSRNVWRRCHCSCASLVASCCSAAHSDRIAAPTPARSGCAARSSESLVMQRIIAPAARRSLANPIRPDRARGRFPAVATRGVLGSLSNRGITSSPKSVTVSHEQLVRERRCPTGP